MRSRLLIVLSLISFSHCLRADGFTKAQLDSIARNTTSKQESSIESLSSYFKTITTKDSELARLVFSWVAFKINYDDDSYNSGKFNDPEAESVFKSRKAVCIGYSNVVQSLCDALKIPCKTISGFGKGYGFKDGMPVTGTNHAWNAIYFNNGWHLLDATWASGYAENINGKAVSKKRFADYFFDVNPKEFIFNHFPDSSQYQFLAKEFTRDQFRKLMYVEASAAFPMGFNVDTILTRSSKDIKFKLPEISNPGIVNFKFSKLAYSKNLSKSQSYYFEYTSEEDVKLMFLNEGNPIEIQKIKEHTYGVTLSNLKTGSLLLGSPEDNSIMIILEYKVLSY